MILLELLIIVALLKNAFLDDKSVIEKQSMPVMSFS